MGLKEQINEDVKTAMKAKDEVRLGVLRMLKAKIQEAEVAARGNKKELTEDDVQDVVTKYAKQVRESVDSFEKAGRDDLLQSAQAELKIVEGYLPEQISEDEIREIVKSAVEETGASSMKDMGNVMKIVMPKVKGRADGKQVNQIVRELLG